MEYPLVLFFAFIAYGTYVAFWRLYLSPIAHIPGPRIAALTLWYSLNMIPDWNDSDRN